MSAADRKLGKVPCPLCHDTRPFCHRCRPRQFDAEVERLKAKIAATGRLDTDQGPIRVPPTMFIDGKPVTPQRCAKFECQRVAFGRMLYCFDHRGADQ